MAVISEGQQKGFPTGRKRRELIRLNDQGINRFIAQGSKAMFAKYTWLDSPIDGEPASFCYTFEDILPHKKLSMRKNIEYMLSRKSGDAVGIEFGGPGSELFQGFAKRFFKRSFGVTLVDLRSLKLQYKDSRIHHTVVEGNILSPNTCSVLLRHLKGHKVDFIIERMGRGLEFVPVEPYTIAGIFSLWYSLLQDGGIMFVQTPVALNPLLSLWVKTVQESHKERLPVIFKEGIENRRKPSSVLFIHKTPDSPRVLPLLHPRVVQRVLWSGNPKLGFSDW